MNILKEYAEFKVNGYHEEEKSDMQYLVDIRDLLIELEDDLENQVRDLENSDVVLNHADAAKHYPMFSLMNDIGEITYRSGKLMNYLDFVRGYE